MGHANLIAEKIAGSMKAIGRDCALQDCTFTFPQWSLRVDVLEGQIREHPDGLVLLPAVVARHRLRPKGFARELAVGIGKTPENAANAIAAAWGLLFFPLLKFMFDEHPHDCTVHDEPILLPIAVDQAYRLVAG